MDHHVSQISWGPGDYDNSPKLLHTPGFEALTGIQYYSITALGNNTNNPIWDCQFAWGFLMLTTECYDNSTRVCSHRSMSRKIPLPLSQGNYPVPLGNPRLGHDHGTKCMM